MRRARERGSALLEVALVLPVIVTIFVGLADFAGFYYRQTQVETLARTAAMALIRDRDGFAAGSSDSFKAFSETIQESAKHDPGLVGVTVTLTRHYTCVGRGLEEKNLTSHPSGCAGERAYIQIDTRYPISAMLQPLQSLGYPKAAMSRLFVRMR